MLTHELTRKHPIPLRLNELHQLSGGKSQQHPRHWLSLNRTQDLMGILKNERLQKSSNPSNGAAYEPIAVYKGANVSQGTYVDKILFLDYARWLSPELHLRILRHFESSHTRQPDQLPADPANLSPLQPIGKVNLYTILHALQEMPAVLAEHSYDQRLETLYQTRADLERQLLDVNEEIRSRQAQKQVQDQQRAAITALLKATAEQIEVTQTPCSDRSTCH